ncbi:MAG: AMP-binding protein, partial [Ramlibacter sp.]
MVVSQRRDNQAGMHAGFGWRVPDDFNIAQACSARWAAAPDANGRVAIRAHGAAPGSDTLTYGSLQRSADRLSHALAALGVRRGDRVAIVMPQRFETAIAYIAVFQMGAVAMPLSMLFGPDALEYRLRNSEAAVAICDESSIANMLAIRDQCPALRTIIGVGAAALQADLDWRAELDRHRGPFAAVRTKAGDGAVLIYTSGTTGPPKGALIPHRALIGNLPGFVCSQNWFGFDPGGSEIADLATSAGELTPSPVRGRVGVGAGTFGEAPASPGVFTPSPTRGWGGGGG